MIPFPDKKYKIIYADPPWNGLGWNNDSGLLCGRCIMDRIEALNQYGMITCLCNKEVIIWVEL